jgi:hypothetical protein
MKEELNKLRQQLNELQSRFDAFAARVDAGSLPLIIGGQYIIKSKEGKVENRFEIGDVVSLIEANPGDDYGDFSNGFVNQYVSLCDIEYYMPEYKIQ